MAGGLLNRADGNTNESRVRRVNRDRCGNASFHVVVGGEEEKLVLDDRSAQVALKVICHRQQRGGSGENWPCNQLRGRPKARMLPWSCLVPDGVMTLKMSPAILPNSGATLFDSVCASLT